MLKILQINTTLNTGSTGKIAEEIGKVILQNKSNSFIAYSRIGSVSQSETVPIGNKIDLYYHILFTRLLDRHGQASGKATGKFIHEIDQINPDIIHLHNIHGYYLNFEILINYLKKLNKPVVWTLHDCWPITGHCSYFDRFNCEKWKTECNHCPMTKYYPESWFIDNSANNFKSKKRLFNQLSNLSIVTPSAWLEKIVQESFLKKYPVQVINNGVDLELFKMKNEKNKSIKKNILGVASIWDDRKGLNDFIQLRDLLQEDFSIILIGLSKDQIESLPKGIKGITRTENSIELMKYYQEADVFINPTYSDNFPTTNLEALACGTPVITYNTGGSPEAIDDYTGIVVQKGDIQGIQKAIETILANQDKFTPEHCRSRAERLFNKNERFEDYYSLYVQLMSKYSSLSY